MEERGGRVRTMGMGERKIGVVRLELKERIGLESILWWATWDIISNIINYLTLNETFIGQANCRLCAHVALSGRYKQNYTCSSFYKKYW